MDLRLGGGILLLVSSDMTGICQKIHGQLSKLGSIETMQRYWLYDTKCIQSTSEMPSRHVKSFVKVYVIIYCVTDM